MHIDSIHNGIVIDHITAGRGMEIYKLLHLDRLDSSVAIIKNAPSRKMGKKDIIKVDADIDIDTNVLGYVDPNVTVDIIRNGHLAEKRRVGLPTRPTKVLFFKKPPPRLCPCRNQQGSQSRKQCYRQEMQNTVFYQKSSCFRCLRYSTYRHQYRRMQNINPGGNLSYIPGRASPLP